MVAAVLGCRHDNGVVGVVPFSVALTLWVELGGVTSTDLFTPHLCCKERESIGLFEGRNKSSHDIFLSPILTNQIVIKPIKMTRHHMLTFDLWHMASSQFTEVILGVHFSLQLSPDMPLLSHATLGLISCGKFGRPLIT